MKATQIVFLSLLLIGGSVTAQNVPVVKIEVYPLYTSAPVDAEQALLVQYDVPEGTHLTENFLEVTIE